MSFYSDFARARSRQIFADVLAVVVIVLSIVLGVATHAAVRAFATLGEQLESAGSGLRQTMTDAANTLGDVPLIGGGIRSPLDSASDAGGFLADAGADQQQLVGRLAVALGIIVALVPIAIVLRVWLRRRLVFAKNAALARNLASTDSGLDLLALRALGRADPRDILAALPDATARWRAGDEETIRFLAALALQDAGVRMPGRATR